MRRPTLVALLAAVMVMAMAMGGSAAFAGEVTGSGQGGPNGDGIPGSVGNGRSACLYSGLEDGGDYPDQPEGPGVAPQNWGHTKDAPIIVDSRGVSWVLLDLSFLGLGVVVEGCNPHLVEGPHN